MKTKLINIRSKQPYDIYIGRWNGHYKLSASIWANPDKSARDKPPEQAKKEFQEYVRSRPDLMGSLHELKGKTLACWCCSCKETCDGNCPCHGNWLIELLEEQEKEGD